MQPLALHSERLNLRALRLEQAQRLAELGNDPLIAAHTANFPSPYTVAAARDYITQSSSDTGAQGNWVLGIELHDGTLLGVINLKLTPRHRSGHLGYWLGAPYRGHGYMTEAVRALVRYSFEVANLHRVETACFAVNQASASVLAGAGLALEGCKRQAFFKDGVFHDLLMFGTTAQAWTCTADAPASGLQKSARKVTV